MKMKKEHYELLKAEIAENLKSNPGIKETYKRRGFSKERFAWDIFHFNSSICGVLYTYLYDAEIQTALFEIIGDY